MQQMRTPILLPMSANSMHKHTVHPYTPNTPKMAQKRRVISCFLHFFGLKRILNVYNQQLK
nr:MAG TPA: hypothetical protein [Caudoviricetes sp.]